MAQQQQQQQQKTSRLKLLIALLALGLGMYIVGPPLYWQIIGGFGSEEQCPICTCDCSTSNLVNAAVQDIGNFSLVDCSGRQDAEVLDESEKSRAQLLAEELKLQEAVAEDNRQRSEMVLLDAKRVSSQYQKEAEKCNIGMETSEEARERAEAALGQALKEVTIWKNRAKQLGWKDQEAADDEQR